MSIFSKIKGSKKAAQQHKEKTIADENQQKKSEQEVAKVPYKHIPTHAAIDALSGAPSSWKNEDRTKIREHHKRRGQMTISRTHSALSTVSSMSNTIESNSVIPSSPRAISHDSYNPTWNNRVGDMSYLTEKLQSRTQPPTKPQHSNHGIDSAIGRSPLSSRGQSEATSPATSSRNSTKTSSSSSSSCDDLEIASSVPRRLQPRHSFRPEPVVFEDRDIFTKLHTSTTRKLGEAPIMSKPQNQLPKPASVIVAPPKSKKA
ncbi:d927eb9d-8b65-47ad-96d1-0f00a28cb735 [Sclerotinia trifoliorum]|uniref:D927eb9d-8b65-47ad-96d1-0f00a28cb735 n=1 Tax=Sclerotinia trifoliorum TaxID=28548 RepID=A0A8H2W1F5_9HELO|nr:d927eb9d-8b65-47ad-96d1-0f00a28cb735 [Sclerotinia trifoliorum]